MTKTLLFVRHAESQANTRPDIIGGRANHVELTERGVEQAKRVGRYLGQIGAAPQLVYRSPAVRTMQTAEHALVAADIHADIYIHDGLQEMAQGIFEGRDRDEIYTPEKQAEMDKAGKDAKLDDEDAESMTEVGERMHAAAGEIADHIDDGRVALVFGHGLAIRCLASHIEDWSRKKTYAVTTHNTSLTEVTYEGGVWNVSYVGQTPHMKSTAV